MTGARLRTMAPAGVSRRARLGGLGDNRAVRLLAGLIPIVAFVAIWWVITASLDRARVYPTPDIIWDEIVVILGGSGETGSTYDHILATLYRLVAAFAVSFVLGTTIGILAGRVKLVFSLVENLVWVFMAVPSVVWVFLFAVAIGITDVVPIAAVSALLTPMIIVGVAEGAKSIPRDILEMAESYKATTRQRVKDIYLPFLVPYLASSARTAFALGVKIIVVAEVIGLEHGVGFEIKYWYGRLFMGPIVAWGIVMIVIGIVVDYGIFGPIERRVSRWKGRPVTEAVVGGIG
jgi:NitT/TauT family transport system permease protein